MSRLALILASASPRRGELLRQMGYEFQVIPGDAEEVHASHLTPREMCQLNAYRKAETVARGNPDALVIGADTLVFKGLQVFGKPRDLSDAGRMLRELGGHTHEVITGVCLIHWRKRRKRLFSASTAVTFRPLSDEQIRAYFARVNPLDKAGAYAIQEAGDLLVQEIEGSFSNVVGLPTEALQIEIEAWGPQRCARV